MGSHLCVASVGRKENEMDTWGYIILIAGAVVIGLVAQFGIRRVFGYEWVLTAIGAGIGGYVASEYDLAGLGKWGTEVAGLAIFPAIIGALVLAAVIEVVLLVAERPTVRV